MVQQRDMSQLSLSKSFSVLGLLDRVNGNSVGDGLHQTRRAASDENPEAESRVKDPTHAVIEEAHYLTQH